MRPSFNFFIAEKQLLSGFERKHNVKFTFESSEKKVIVVMPAFNAAKTLSATLNEMPRFSFDQIILVDDGSTDETVSTANHLGIEVLKHSQNLGYGANQKTCYKAALERNADIVVLLHPDNQYNPGIIPNMVLPIYLGQADVVLASRFIQDPLKGGPIVGGMPIHKYFVNRALSSLQNLLMGTYFSEFHTGYRAFSRSILSKIDFTSLSDDFLFDNQIIAVFTELHARFCQIGVETRYFPEASTISLIPGIHYAIGCLGVGCRYFLHRKGILSWKLLQRSLK